MRIVSVFIAALVATCGPAWSAGLSADRNEIAEAEIKALELHLAKLLVSRSFDEYEQHLAADYTRISASGVVETRE